MMTISQHLSKSFLLVCLLSLCLQSWGQELNKLYTDPENEFSVSLPENWNEPDLKPHQKVMLTDKKNRKKTISVIKMELPVTNENQSTEEFKQHEVETLLNMENQGKLKLNTFGFDTINGTKWVKFDVTEKAFRTISYHCIYKKTRYSFYYTSPHELFAKDSAIALASFTTFQFFKISSLVNTTSSPKPAVVEKKVDTAANLHQPFIYSFLYQDEKGLALRSDAKANVPVTILDFSGRRIFSLSTTDRKAKISIEGGEEEIITYLNKSPATTTPFVYMVGLLNSTESSYRSLIKDTLTDITSIKKIHQQITNDKAVQRILSSTEMPGDFKNSIPLIFPLSFLPNAYLACYRKKQNYIEPLPYQFIVYVVDDKVHPVSGDCSNFRDVYQLGDSCFLYSDWEPCDGDESMSKIYQLKKNGLKIEATF